MDIINFSKNTALGRYKSRLAQKDRMLYYPIDGFSNMNIYVPYYAAWSHKGLYKKDEKTKILHYGIPYQTVPTRLKSGYTFLYSMLNQGTIPCIFKTPSLTEDLHVMKGLIFEMTNKGLPKIHFLLAVKSDYIFNMDGVHFDRKKFVLFLSTELTTEKRYGSIYSKLKKDVIEVLQRTGVDTIITNNIDQWCYKNSLILPKFKTLQAKADYLQTFNTYTVNG